MDTTLQCSGYLPKMTLIHNEFIENHMLSANGSYVKVYLYISKCIQAGENNLSISTLADKMDNTEKDILRALHYWEKHNLVQLVKDESGITEIKMLNPECHVTAHDSERTQIKDTPIPKSANTDKVDVATYTKENTDTDVYINADIGTESIENVKDIDASKDQNVAVRTEDTSVSGQIIRLPSDEKFVWTCRVIESYVSRPLNPKEVELIFYLYDNLNFSSDLLLYLYEYCISLGKTNVNYIQTVAISWHEQGIQSPEDAKKYSSDYNAAYTAISKAFGFGRQLAMVEKQFVSRWLNDWNMDLAVVLDACNRTMLKLQRADFKYTEGILDNWHNNDIHTLQDVEKADEEYAKNKPASPTTKSVQNTFYNKNPFNRFQQREISQEELDELEKKLLAR